MGPSIHVAAADAAAADSRPLAAAAAADAAAYALGGRADGGADEGPVAAALRTPVPSLARLGVPEKSKIRISIIKPARKKTGPPHASWYTCNADERKGASPDWDPAADGLRGQEPDASF